MLDAHTTELGFMPNVALMDSFLLKLSPFYHSAQLLFKFGTMNHDGGLVLEKQILALYQNTVIIDFWF